MTRPRSLRSALLIWAVAITGVVFMISTGLPWLAEHGYAGRVIQENVQYDRDATALFYTEHERTWEILRALPDHRAPVARDSKPG